MICTDSRLPAVDQWQQLSPDYQTTNAFFFIYSRRLVQALDTLPASLCSLPNDRSPSTIYLQRTTHRYFFKLQDGCGIKLKSKFQRQILERNLCQINTIYDPLYISLDSPIKGIVRRKLGWVKSDINR
jgi:hypothetical protein